MPAAMAKAGADRVRYPHLYKSYKSSDEPAIGHSYSKAMMVRNAATREATIAFEDDWTYREMQSFHEQLPPLVDFRSKFQRTIERKGNRVFDVVTVPCPNGNVHIWYFEITGTPLD